MTIGPRTDNEIAVIVQLEDASHIIVSIWGAVCQQMFGHG